MPTQIDIWPAERCHHQLVTYNWACEKRLYNVYHIFLFLTDNTQVTLVRLILYPKGCVNFPSIVCSTCGLWYFCCVYVHCNHIAVLGVNLIKK